MSHGGMAGGALFAGTCAGALHWKDCWVSSRQRSAPSPTPMPPMPVRTPHQAYKLRQVQATHIKPESGRLMLVLHVSAGSVQRAGPRERG